MNKSSAAQFISRRIYELRARRSQLEIATAAGFKSANMLSMVKDGKAKLPLERVISLAKALECDARHLMRLALEQSLSQPVLDEIFAGANGPRSSNEHTILVEIRRLSQNSDPALTADLAAALAQALTGTTTRVPPVSPTGNNLMASALVALDVGARAAHHELNLARQFYRAADNRVARAEARLGALRSELDLLIPGRRSA